MMMMTAAPRFDKQCFYLAVTALFICLLMCKSSSARPLLISPPLADTQRVGSTTAAAAADQEVGENSLLTVEKLATHDHDQQQVGGILGVFVMNVLPRGITPPSGPSRRNNGVKT